MGSCYFYFSIVLHVSDLVSALPLVRKKRSGVLSQEPDMSYEIARTTISRSVIYRALGPSALCRVGPGIEWILLLFFLPSLRYLRSSLRYDNLLCALLPLRFCTGSTRGQDVSLDLRVPSTQSDDVGKPQSPAPNLIGPCTRIPAAYWRWKTPPQNRSSLSSLAFPPISRVVGRISLAAAEDCGSKQSKGLKTGPDGYLRESVAPVEMNRRRTAVSG